MIQKLTCFLLLLVISNTITAQDNTAIDSLVKKGKELVGKDGDLSIQYSSRAFTLAFKENYYWGKMSAAQGLAEAYYYEGNMDSACRYDDIALNLSREKNDMPELANNLVAKGTKISDLGKKPEALQLYNEAEQIFKARKDTFKLADLYLRVGKVYLETDQNEKAMSILAVSRDYSKLLKNEINEAAALSSMAVIEKHIGNSQKAIEMMNECMQLYKMKNNDYGVISALNNLGVYYKELGEYPKAMAAYKAADTIAKKLNNDRIFLVLGDNKGILLNLMGQYAAAEKVLLQAKSLAIKMRMTEGLADTKMHLAESLYRQGKSNEAIPEIEDGIKFATEIKSFEKERDAHQIALEIYQGTGNLKLALLHSEALQVAKDSIFNIEKTKQINNLQTKYETAQKDAQIALLNKNAELDKTKRRSLLIAIVLMALTGISFIYSLITKRKREREKLMAEKEIEQQKRVFAEQELEFKQKELTSKVLQLARKNEFLNLLQEEITTLKTSVDSSVTQTSKKITRMITRDIEEDKQWDQFSIEFSSLYTGFIEALSTKHGELSKSEIRLISLLKMNLSSKDIADTLQISKEGISKARYRLRKKLDLNTDDDLHTYLFNFKW